VKGTERWRKSLSLPHFFLRIKSRRLRPGFSDLALPPLLSQLPKLTAFAFTRFPTRNWNSQNSNYSHLTRELGFSYPGPSNGGFNFQDTSNNRRQRKLFSARHSAIILKLVRIKRSKMFSSFVVTKNLAAPSPEVNNPRVPLFREIRLWKLAYAS